MRNIMICVSVMLAVFLGWPLAFGGHGSGGLEPGRAEARPVAAAPAAVAAAEKPKPVEAMVQQAVGAPSVPESCYKRYQREIKLCSGNAGAACRLKNADDWDLCEATGFWPN